MREEKVLLHLRAENKELRKQIGISQHLHRHCQSRGRVYGAYPIPGGGRGGWSSGGKAAAAESLLIKGAPLTKVTKPAWSGKGGQGKRGCQTVNKPICACNGVSADSALSSNTALLAGRAAPQNCWRKSCRIAQKFIPVRTCTTFKLYVQVCTGTNGNICHEPSCTQ